MTKVELIARVAEKTDMTKKDAEAAVNAVLDSVTEALAAGDKVVLSGFGSFEIRERAAREGVSPFSGEKIQIAASKTPVFKARKALKDAVNQ